MLSSPATSSSHRRPGPPGTRRGVDVFLMRFDMRAPATGASTTELYAAAMEMASWAESRGALVAAVCEHHTMQDGYLPSPLVLATALAARTTTLPIMTAALVLPLYDPIRLAEDMVVLDIISGGRVSYVMAVGYRPEEYEHHGVDFHRRGKIADEALRLLLRAKTGEPFEHGGRHIHVTPPPLTAGGPQVSWGGGSIAAAKRAGRFGLDFIAQGGDPALEAVYQDERRANGHRPGFCMIPPLDMATTVFVAHDLDQAWDELGPYLLHDVVSYASINEGNTHTASLSTATTVEDLRAENRTHRIVSVDEAIELVRAGTPLPLQPLVGGVPPDIAWPYLRIVTDEVMPAVNDQL
jgi:alkanesulfonate monooxygenase SsuD/methylene tetrahydromethanopterin reductase-like flavin-dependent oxidoreductase (luciferase family)